MKIKTNPREYNNYFIPYSSSDTALLCGVTVLIYIIFNISKFKLNPIITLEMTNQYFTNKITVCAKMYKLRFSLSVVLETGKCASNN